MKEDDIVPGTSPTACVRIQKGFLHTNMWLLSLDKSITQTHTPGLVSATFIPSDQTLTGATGRCPSKQLWVEH